ncbi:MAG: hypothetical protein WC428_02550 [Candidatus Paceibacterota bacterium]
MEDNIKKAIEEYQCSGCITGMNTECFEAANSGCGCGKHYAGTMILPGIGKIFLGMPKGFNRLGEIKDMKPFIFEDLKNWGEYNKYNVPVWKYLDKNGNTIVRGLQPRLNAPFIHIILKNCINEINCELITDTDINEMD